MDDSASYMVKTNKNKTIQMNSGVLDRLLTRKEVAEIIGRSTRTVQELEYRGLLPRVEFSKRHIRYKQSDLKKLIDRLTIEGKAISI